MERSSIFHRAKSSYAYAYDKETLHIKIKTKKNEVKRATLIYGDPFDYEAENVGGDLAKATLGWNRHKKDMAYFGSDMYYDFWFVEIKPEWRRVKYAFILYDDNEVILFGEKKTVNIESDDDKELYNQRNFFAFPFINGIDVYNGPDWVKDTMWYQIFPERFANGDPSNDPENGKEWGTSVEKLNEHFGGDLKGVMDHLDYLQDLGINGIYFTPIFHAYSYHKYDTIDYFNIDPMFGDNVLFKEFVKECHLRDIKVMLDGVFNHSGIFFKEFQDVLENGEKSIYKDWFHIREFPLLKKDLDSGEYITREDFAYDSFAFTPYMPKLNTENPKMKEMLLNVGKYWVERYDIDAWRLDVANEVDHRFWREFRDAVNSTGKQCYILAEIWHDAMSWLHGDQFDAVMNYPLRDAALSFFATNEINAEEFKMAVDKTNFEYPLNVNENMYNLLDSHDTARIKHLSSENREKVKLAYTFMFTHIGSPAIYYGDEVGLTGGDDPDNRRCMEWEEDKQDKDMLNFMKKLIRIRKENPILSYKGDLKWIYCEGNVIIYKRFFKDEAYYVVLNNSDTNRTIKSPKELIGKKFEDLISYDVIEYNEKYDIKPYEILILQSK